MRLSAFASRNIKELVRDKLNLFFAIGFPVILLLLLSAINANIPGNNEVFVISKLAPGISVFGLSFISLFSGMLIAKDRTSSFMLRLFASPLTASDFIFGYTLPLIPIAVAQAVLCFAVALLLGLEFCVNILLTIVVLIPSAILFIGIGLLCGSLLNDKQCSGVCGALLTNLCAWMSGVWFDVSLVGGWFEKISNALPFVHAVNAGKAAMAGEYSNIMPELLWVIAYAIVIMALAVFAFTKKMSSDKI